MAIPTIAGFNISFPELVDSRTGPFSSYEDAIDFTNQNFRVIGQKVIIVDNATYRNLETPSPTITGGDYREFVYTGTVDDSGLSPISPKIFNVNTSSIDIEKTSNSSGYTGGYIRFINSNPSVATRKIVNITSNNGAQSGEIIEFATSESDFIFFTKDADVYINDVNRQTNFASCTLRCLSANYFEVVG